MGVDVAAKLAFLSFRTGDGSDAATTAPKAGLAADMLDFINYAWSPYHAVEEGSRRLMGAGFKHISEKDVWEIKPGGK